MARVYPFLSSYDILLRIQIYLSINFKKFIERKNLLLFFYLNYYIFNYI